MKVHVCEPIGFCVGVANSIDMALRVKRAQPKRNVVVLSMLVHNEFVQNMLEEWDIKTIYRPKTDLVDLIDEIPPYSLVVLSSHGHSKAVEDKLKKKQLDFVDSTCFKVQDNIDAITKAVKKGHEVIYIGKGDRLETKAALSYGKDKIFLFEPGKRFIYKNLTDDSPLVVNQTSISFLELANIHTRIAKRFPKAEIRDEICAAVRIRQQALMKIPSEVDLIYVVGDKVSSNTSKLFELATKYYPHATVRIVRGLSELQKEDYQGKKYAAIAGGTATPRQNCEVIIEFLKSVEVSEEDQTTTGTIS